MSDQELDVFASYDFASWCGEEEDWNHHTQGTCGGPDNCYWCWLRAETERDLNYEEDLP